MLGALEGDYIKLAKIPSTESNYQLDYKRWSPNDQYIALSITRFKDGTEFQIIDLENEQIISSCMVVDQFEMDLMTAYMLALSGRLIVRSLHFEIIMKVQVGK